MQRAEEKTLTFNTYKEFHTYYMNWSHGAIIRPLEIRLCIGRSFIEHGEDWWGDSYDTSRISLAYELNRMCGHPRDKGKVIIIEVPENGCIKLNDVDFKRDDLQEMVNNALNGVILERKIPGFTFIGAGSKTKVTSSTELGVAQDLPRQSP